MKFRYEIRHTRKRKYIRYVRFSLQMYTTCRSGEVLLCYCDQSNDLILGKKAFLRRIHLAEKNHKFPPLFYNGRKIIIHSMRFLTFICEIGCLNSDRNYPGASQVPSFEKNPANF